MTGEEQWRTYNVELVDVNESLHRAHKVHRRILCAPVRARSLPRNELTTEHRNELWGLSRLLHRDLDRTRAFSALCRSTTRAKTTHRRRVVPPRKLLHLLPLPLAGLSAPTLPRPHLRRHKPARLDLRAVDDREELRVVKHVRVLAERRRGATIDGHDIYGNCGDVRIGRIMRPGSAVECIYVDARKGLVIVNYSGV